jgi:hypothetical protein
VNWPYRRTDKIIDAVDEWFHERGFGWVQVEGKPARVKPWWGRFVKPLCDVRERRIIGKDEWASQQANVITTTSSSGSQAYTNILWKIRHPHKGRRDV